MFTGEIQRSRSKKPMVAVGLFILLVVAIVLLLPLPNTVESRFVLKGGTSNEVKAPRDGKVAEVLSASGKLVASGAPLLRLEAGEAEARVTALTARLEALGQAKPATEKEAAKSAADVQKAEAAAQAARTALTDLQAKADATAAPMLANAEKQLQAATEALEQVRARARFTEAGLKTEKEDVRKALAAAKAEVDSATLRSPVAGMVASLSVVPGAEVKKDAPVALVEGSATLHAMVDQPARQPLRKGMSVDLLLPSGRKKYTFADDAKDGQAVVDLDNAKGELQLGLQGTAEIAGDDTNFLSRLLGR